MPNLKIKIYIAFIISFIIPLRFSYSQEQCDFDSDNLSDYTYLGSSGTSLSWSTVLSGSANNVEAVNFGVSSDQPAVAHWLSETKPNLGIVRLNSNKTSLIWKVYQDSGSLLEETFGKADSVYLSGADFDGNGISDAAVVEKTSGGLKWTVKLNLFSGSDRKTLKFIHGEVGDRVLFLNPDGEKDWAGVFGKDSKGRAVITLRNLSTKKKKKIKGFNKKLISGSRPRPFPVRAPDGSDVIGVLTSEDGVDSKLLVYNLSGKLRTKKTFNGLGDVITGNFDNTDDGEEIAFFTGTSLIIFNPFSGTETKATPVSNTLVDEVNIQTINAPTAVPTTAPTATVSPTATTG